jgi:hypothetical protein
MPDSQWVDEEVSELMRQLLRTLAGPDEQRVAALAELESALRRLLQRASRAPQESSTSGASRRDASPPVDRRFIREVIAPELEQYWARQKKDPRSW